MESLVIFIVGYVILIIIIFILLQIIIPLLYSQNNNNCAQGNGNEAARDSPYNDIFFIEPNRQEAARIRAQLEKDDKDLPTYDEVMRIANVPSATTVQAVPAMPSALTMGASGSSVNTTDTVLPVLPFREAENNVRPLTPPPYTLEPIGATVVLPIEIPLRSQPTTQTT